MLAAIWLAATAPDTLGFLASLEIIKSEPTSLATLLRIAACLATVASLLAWPRWTFFVAIAGEAALYYLVAHVPESGQELCALHLAWFGLLLGIRQLAAERETDAPEGQPGESFDSRAFLVQDLILAGLAIAAAAIVSIVVLQRWCDSADEWAYTYQAAVFAKLHAYGKAPPCFSALQMYWVFTSEGRMFSQYTPGWSLFMAPFLSIGVVWLAGPCSLGLLAVAVARLARRAVAGASGGRGDVVVAAGPIAAIALVGSSTVLINGGSRFSHIFVCACFAWSVEALSEMSRPSGHMRSPVGWGVVLGLASAWLLSTRPADGGTLGIGLFVYFVYAVADRRVAWRAMLATVTSFAIWGAFSLVVLRLQLGKWFATGYSLTAQFQAWSRFSMSAPKLGELKWGIPLATGAHCWWPLAPTIGLYGLFAALRREGRRVSFMLVVGTLALITFYSCVEFGRGGDFGYGPRHILPVIVPMAVGTAVALSPLWAAARARVHSHSALALGGPALLAITAAVVGVVRIAPLIYPYNREDVRGRNAIRGAVERDHLTNAIIWLEPGTTVADPRDLTQNYPLELYPPPPVIFAIDTGEDMKRCVREQYPGRKSYRSDSKAMLVPE